MRKKICFLLAVTLTVSLSGCSENNRSNRNYNSPAGVKDILDAEMTEDYTIGSEEQIGVPSLMSTEDTKALTEPSGTTNADGIDIDLTSLSSTMVYAEVYNIMLSPESYMGKKIKMQGSLSVFHDETTDKDYFACIIKDATACCAQGIEFALTDDYVYPDDYPNDGEEICVVGTFSTYREGEITYCRLSDAKLV